jgi:two-component system, NarL family, sensor histidine kinase LiaS
MFFKWPHRKGILVQMALSYIWITAASLLTLQVLAFAINGFTLTQLPRAAFRTAVIAVVVIAPIGGLFGLITTGPYVKRVGSLVSAAEHFAGGDYTYRVPVVHATDEMGLLEQQFNRMADQLVESNAQQQKLTEQNARMQERARISRDLHDAISQNLFSMRTLANGLHAAIQAGSSAKELEPHVALLEQTAISTSREMRALLLEMRPPQLEGLSFSDALATLADSYAARLGLAVTTAISAVEIDASGENALLRITQEAFNNAARHSNATVIHLELVPQGDMAALRVTDNGQGFDPAEHDQSYGLGLRLMQERASELGGRFSIETGVGRGTRIEIQIPQEKVHDPGSDR